MSRVGYLAAVTRVLIIAINTLALQVQRKLHKWFDCFLYLFFLFPSFLFVSSTFFDGCSTKN